MRIRSWRPHLSVLFVVLAGAMAVGCAPASAPPAPTPLPKVGEEARPTPKPAAKMEKVRMQLAAIAGTYQYFAIGKEQGLFKDQGIDLEIIIMKAGLDTPALLSGDIDFSTTSTPVQAAFQGAALKLIMGTVTKVDFFLMVAPEIKTAQDLKGKIIGGGTLGAAGHIGTMEALKIMGMADPYKEVTWVSIPDPERIPALKAGSVAAISAKANFAQMAKAMGFKELLFTADYVEALSNGLATTDKKIRENPEQVKRIIRSTIKSVMFYRDNPEEVIKFNMAATQMDRETARAIWDAQLRSSTVTGTVSEKALQGLVDMARISVAIKGTVSAEQAVNFSLLREVQKEMGLPVQPEIRVK